MTDNISRSQKAEQALTNTEGCDMEDELESGIIDMIANLLHPGGSKRT